MDDFVTHKASALSAANDEAGPRDDAPRHGEAIPETPPTPLTKPVAPAAPYPLDALGDVLGAAAKAVLTRCKLCGCGETIGGAEAFSRTYAGLRELKARRTFSCQLRPNASLELVRPHHSRER